METEITKNEVEVSPPRLADPVVAPEMEGVNAEEGEVSVSMKAEEEEVAIPLPPPLEPPSPMPMHESIPQPMEHGMVDESMRAVETVEITITDQVCVMCLIDAFALKLSMSRMILTYNLNP
mmetsp:Transcript_26473/g.50228  ORF Transcript_26473/g.50228 Transcript_26473/m.50228 type:complete len:121 (-) Transcript_26473:1011-1373(-)